MSVAQHFSSLQNFHIKETSVFFDKNDIVFSLSNHFFSFSLYLLTLSSTPNAIKISFVEVKLS